MSSTTQWLESEPQYRSQSLKKDEGMLCPETFGIIDKEWCESFLSGVPKSDMELCNKAAGCKYLARCNAYKKLMEDE